jgi:phenylalanyl-tRNA synthetase beta chain
MTGLGLDEACTFSLVGEPLDAPLWEEPARASLRVDHSSRKKENALRQSLVPSLLAARAYNEAHGVTDAALFEIATVYRPGATAGQTEESVRVGMVSGFDFFGMKGLVESLLGSLHVAGPLATRPVALAALAPGRAAELRLGATLLGYLGELGDAWRGELGLRSACSAAELDLQPLIDQARLVPQYTVLPPFPPVNRDLALVVDRAVPWAEIDGVARAAAGHLLEELTYLDTFVGGNLPADRQSIHFGLRFRHPERTLTSEEVDRAIEQVVQTCGTRLGAELRA